MPLRYVIRGSPLSFRKCQVQDIRQFTSKKKVNTTWFLEATWWPVACPNTPTTTWKIGKQGFSEKFLSRSSRKKSSNNLLWTKLKRLSPFFIMTVSFKELKDKIKVHSYSCELSLLTWIMMDFIVLFKLKPEMLLLLSLHPLRLLNFFWGLKSQAIRSDNHVISIMYFCTEDFIGTGYISIESYHAIFDSFSAFWTKLLSSINTHPKYLSINGTGEIEWCLENI